MDVRLVIEKGSTEARTIRLRKAETVIGRLSKCQLRIPGSGVSRKHCRLTFADGLLTVEDLDSSNGTFVNGKRIKKAKVLRPGDQLRVGPVVFRVKYKLPEEEEVPEMDVEEVSESVDEEEVSETDEVEEVSEEVLESDPETPESDQEATNLPVELEDLEALEEGEEPVEVEEEEKEKTSPELAQETLELKGNDKDTATHPAAKKGKKGQPKNNETQEIPSEEILELDLPRMPSGSDIRDVLSELENS